jgi:hypothetical protein
MSYQAPQAVFIRKLDPESYLDELEVGRKEKPAVGAGQVLVRLLARPVNPADVLSVQGEFFSDRVLLVSKQLSMLRLCGNMDFCQRIHCAFGGYCSYVQPARYKIAHVCNCTLIVRFTVNRMWSRWWCMICELSLMICWLEDGLLQTLKL